MTAIPGTWEATPLTDDQQSLLSEQTWTISNVVMLVPRIGLAVSVFAALAVVGYAAGDRTIIGLMPAADVNNANYSINDFMTWGVGLCVLAASVWYVPRVLLTAVLSLVTIPMSFVHRSQDAAPVMPQVYSRWPFAICAAAVGFMSTYIAWYSPVLDEGFSPLQPVLRDNFWLLIHVLTIVSSYGAGALAWGLGNIALFYYLFGKYQEPVTSGHLPAGHRPATDDFVATVTRRPPVECATLANYTYKVVQVAVLLLITGTILGGLWADVSWGRFWGWDPKEVWALISGLVYLAILHGRYSGWFGNFGMAVGSVLGASAIIFSWYGVNFYLGVGLHAYGFGSGGQAEVGSAVLINWLFVAAASARYLWETSQGNGVIVDHHDSHGNVEEEMPV
jgi:ABC-type transport system involved in cytochrome c biogenesis permease subunit